MKRVRKEWTVIKLRGWKGEGYLHFAVNIANFKEHENFGRMTREEAEAMMKLLNASEESKP